MRFLKLLSSACLISFSLSGLVKANNISLPGVLLQESEDGKPFSNVTVSAEGAVNAKSDSTGKFQLLFGAQRVGQEGYLQLALPKGWEVMFTIMSKYKVLPSAPENKIIVCPMARCDELRKVYLRKKMHLIVDNHYKKKLAELKRKERVTQEEIDQLLAELNKDKAQVHAPDIVEQLVRMPEKEASWIHRQLWDLIVQGDLEKALQVMWGSEVARIEALQKQREEALLQSWLLRAELADTNNDFPAAENAYEKAVTLAPQSAQAWYKYGQFHQKMKNVKQAHTGLEKALELRRQLAQTNPQMFLPDVAETLIALGQLNKTGNQTDQAQSYFKEALAIIQKIAAQNPTAYTVKIEKVQTELDAIQSSK